MTSRRKAKKAPDGLWRPWWIIKAGKRYKRAGKNYMPLWVYFYWAQSDGLEGRFSHARVLARKPRAGRKRC